MRDRVVDFARALRGPGIAVGTDQVALALRALDAIDVTRPADVFQTLHAVFVRRADERALFELVFRRFWTPGRTLPEPLRGLLESSRLTRPVGPPPGHRRAADALERPGDAASGRAPTGPRGRGGERAGRGEPGDPDRGAERIGSAWSAAERLRTTDFETMSTTEMEEARRAIAALRGTVVRPPPSRRFRPHPAGDRVDVRATLRASVRSAVYGIPLRWKAPVRRPPPLVALCDISGSMARYSRMLLLFMHTLTRQRPRVHTFVFGTRLTNVTRHLRHRDVDEALARVGHAAEDWSGGTRIGRSVDAFNRRWARRVLGGGAVVLLITDGLDRDAGRGLGGAVERLRRSSRRLVWLNPLLRFEGFEPRAAGVRALLPHVDEMRPVHDLASLEELARALSVVR